MKKLLMIVVLMLFAASAHAQFLPPEPEPDCGRPICKLMKPMIGTEDTDQPDSGGIGGQTTNPIRAILYLLKFGDTYSSGGPPNPFWPWRR